jgi:glyoxylase-like metal-dependent hydrolase (beta-lactamase superfamily II)
VEMTSSIDPDQALHRAASEGIHRIEVPTPFPIGPINVYLIDDEPLTLIDTGPKFPPSLEGLERGLDDLGYQVEDIERVVISHQHTDHLGLMDVIQKRSGADIVALDLLAPVLEDFFSYSEKEDAANREIFQTYGLAPEIIYELKDLSEAYRALGARAEVTQRIVHGGTLQFANREFQVLHRPGHSPSDTVFWDQPRAIMIGADHLLKRTSSNPVIHKPLGGKSGLLSEERTRSLATYLESLRETQALPIELILPGHGEPITNSVELIDERLSLHARRARKIEALIEERPRSAFELAEAVWNKVVATQSVLTMSEIIGHVDLLIAEGTVAEVVSNGVIVYERQ